MVTFENLSKTTIELMPLYYTCNKNSGCKRIQQIFVYVTDQRRKCHLRLVFKYL